MNEDGEEQLKETMPLMLSQQQARQYLLQANKQYVSLAIPFSDYLIDELRADGNVEAALNQLSDPINTR